VLDMSADNTFLSQIYSGSDCTYKIAAFLCDPDNPMPNCMASLNARHREFINSALQAFIMKFPIVGQLAVNGYENYDF